jgi:hypothetical protein
MPLVCYGCGDKKPLINRCEYCTFYYEERDIGHAECLNERAAEGLSEEEHLHIIEYAESCPFFEENTVADVCDRCLEESKGVRI